MKKEWGIGRRMKSYNIPLSKVFICV